jgi:glycosyltransferase involved in cell wall biosynthesis
MDSVLAQDYPNFEHIIVDALSTDETPRVLARYHHLHVIREWDRGQADAINKGFARATGNIYCFLNSDDTLAPGALHRVARELDPAAGRHVVAGRCLYIDEDDRPTGREHCLIARPTHRRILEIWRDNPIPQPATFWTAEVWKRCGPLDMGEDLVLDYDLVCRISRHFAVHTIDQVLAHYRLHQDSKTCRHSLDEVKRRALAISRRYWGPSSRPLYWQMLASWAKHQWADAAHRLHESSRVKLENGHRLAAAGRKAVGLLMEPCRSLRNLAHILSLGVLPGKRYGFDQAGDPWADERLEAEVRTWRSFTDLHRDGWAGPRVQFPLRTNGGKRRLIMEGVPGLDYAAIPLDLRFYLDGKLLARRQVPARERFSLKVELGFIPAGEHELEIAADGFVVPHDYRGNRDTRPVAYRVAEMYLLEENKSVGLPLPFAA